MNRCGYIYLAISDTNSQHMMKIISCPCASLEDAPYQDTPSVYLVDKTTFKILSKVTYENSRLPHLTLCDIAKTAVSFDKVLKYPSLLTFTFDKDGNAILHFDKYLKDVFPLPYKSSIYDKEEVYINITEYFIPENVTTNLLSSVLCDYLNNLAVASGILCDRMFGFSCGRVFMNTSYFLNSYFGRKFLKKYFAPSYELMKYKSLVPVFPKGSFKRKSLVNCDFLNNSYKNDVIKAHCSAVNQICEKTDFLSFPHHMDYIISTAREEIISLESSILSLVKNGALEKSFHADNLSIEDILIAYSDPEARRKLKKKNSTNRLFINEAKHRDIKLLFSGGEIVETLYDII